MKSPYTHIQGLSFPKGSDREYTEDWESVPGHPVIRKTINGDSFLTGNERHILTIKGKGDIAPICVLNVGDVVSIKPLRANKSLPFRFEKWGIKYSPWEFQYNWTYTFSEVAS
jgi:hypothetical protein